MESDTGSSHSEAEFTLIHNGCNFNVTVWNRELTPAPIVLYDYNNVLDTYSMAKLNKAAKIHNMPYTIMERPL